MSLKELQARLIELLQEIREHECDHGEEYDDSCPECRRLTELGEEYESIRDQIKWAKPMPSRRRLMEIDQLLAKGQDMKLHDIKRLLELDVSKKNIALALGIGFDTLDKLLDAHGIDHRKKRVKRKIEQKWRAIAKENGINLSVLHKRLDRGMPIAEAATMPPQKVPSKRRGRNATAN